GYNGLYIATYILIMPTQTLVYDDVATAGNLNFSDFFQDQSLIWMSSPSLGTNFNIETTFAIQLYVSAFEIRTYPLNDDALIDTSNIIAIPDEIKFSGINQRLLILVEEDIDLQIYTIATDCCAQAKLDSIENKLNLLLAEKAANFLFNAAILLAGGSSVGQLLLAANAARKWVNIHNPSVEPVLINLGAQATTTDYMLELAPGATFRETDFTGEIYAVSKTGSSVELKVAEF
ncbi:MAG: hypothetical protein ACOC1X_02945, partial [Promethearchaeota archaeon]